MMLYNVICQLYVNEIVKNKFYVMWIFTTIKTNRNYCLCEENSIGKEYSFLTNGVEATDISM